MPRTETLETLKYFIVEPLSDDDFISVIADRLQKPTDDVATAFATVGRAPKAIESFLQAM